MQANRTGSSSTSTTMFSVSDFSHKNILIVGGFTYPFGSAAASRMRNFARGFTSLGADVRVVSLAWLPDRASDCTQRERMDAGIRYESVLGYGSGPQYGLAPLQRLAWYRSLIKAGRQGQRRLDDIIANQVVDIVFIYDRSAMRVESIMRTLHRQGIPMLVDVVEWQGSSSFRGGYLNPLYWDTMKMLRHTNFLSSGIVAISSVIERYYRDRGMPTLLVPAPVDPGLHPPLLSLQPRNVDAPFVLTYLGGLATKDDPFLMLEAVKRLSAIGRSIILNIVGSNGDTGLAAQVRQQCNTDTNLRDRVFFRGRVSDEALAEYLRQSDALILLRSTHAAANAGFPTRLPELLITGCPVITSKAGDLPLYLEDDVHALLAEPNDVQDLINRICAIIDNPSHAQMIGEQGRARAMAIFDYRFQASRLAHFMQECIKQSGQ